MSLSRTFKVLFRIWKPQKIFITDYYNLLHQAVIFSAKELNIKTIEVQHGVISSTHHGYNYYTEKNLQEFCSRRSSVPLLEPLPPKEIILHTN